MTAAVVEGRLLGLVSERLKQVRAPVNVRLWNGQLIRGAEPAPVTLTVHSARALTRLARPTLGELARCYVEGEIDLDGSFRDVLRLGEALVSDRSGAYGTRLPRWRWWGHSRASDRRNIQRHYDVGNDFYALWLDRNRVYSCAYFKTAEDTLDQAQEQKLDHICRKLLLKPGERLLDIGCGWGSLLIHAAREYGVSGVGVTLSEAQAALARTRIADAGLSDRIEIRVQDYREITDGPFDKIASVGMYEHVGRGELDRYAQTVHGLLKPGGLFLNHGIARLHSEAPDKDTFIYRYVFPDGELSPVTDVLTSLQSAGLEVRDVESLREHYPLTLRAW
ncbi:MAG TPA: cyclopropane-fatty-acyl-phospholipid synthase family protein, partial [Burkholderiales bacterium]|nr:cyclopropane-fatty-acyl-phospholipid synthase family protein [Burkholderiales bacterium]